MRKGDLKKTLDNLEKKLNMKSLNVQLLYREANSNIYTDQGGKTYTEEDIQELEAAGIWPIVLVFGKDDEE